MLKQNCSYKNETEARKRSKNKEKIELKFSI